MKKIPFFLVMLLATLLAAAQNNLLTQTVKGTVTDEQSGNVLGNVTIVLEGVKPAIACISDSLGNFKLHHVPIGRQSIRISLTGYEEAFVQNIEVTSTKEVVLEIQLKERIKKLNEVVVTAGRQKSRAVN